MSAGQGASPFRAYLRQLPDLVAEAAEDGFPVVVAAPTGPHAPARRRLMDALGVQVIDDNEEERNGDG